jgi:hypothetical protein
MSEDTNLPARIRGLQPQTPREYDVGAGLAHLAGFREAQRITAELAAAAQAGAEADARDAWVPMSEKSLPQLGDPVLIYIPNSQRGQVKEAHRAIPFEGSLDYFWHTINGMVLPEHVTHWMPLPPAPDA